MILGKKCENKVHAKTQMNEKPNVLGPISDLGAHFKDGNFFKWKNKTNKEKEGKYVTSCSLFEMFFVNC